MEHSFFTTLHAGWLNAWIPSFDMVLIPFIIATHFLILEEERYCEETYGEEEQQNENGTWQTVGPGRCDEKMRIEIKKHCNSLGKNIPNPYLCALLLIEGETTMNLKFF